MPNITKKIANGRTSPRYKNPIKPRTIARIPITIAIPNITCETDAINYSPHVILNYISI